MVNSSGFFLLLINIILIRIRTSSVLIQWVCLEVSMLCVIPILINFSLNKGVKLAVKYFISQNPASILLVIRILSINKIPLCGPLFIVSVIFKLGLPPFQGWVLNILCSVNFWSLFLLLSIQKFIPLILLREVGLSSSLIGFSLAIYTVMIIILIIIINSSYYLLFLSSVLNVYWILGVLSISTTWIDFIMLYCLISARFIFILHRSGRVIMRDFNLSSGLTKLLVITILLNIRGIPPLTGFIIKLIILKLMARSYYFYTRALLVSSVLIIYVYLMIRYQLNRFKGHHIKFNNLHSIKGGIMLVAIGLFPLIPLAVLI